MQLFILALILGIFAHDALGDAPAADAMEAWWHIALWVALPKIALAVLFYVQCRLTLARMSRSGAHGWLRWLHRTADAYRYFVLISFANDLRVGFLVQVRQAMGGNWILIDELIVIAPALAMIFFAWWAYYPVDRAMRQATLISRIDAGLPIHPIWSRGQYLLSQWRHQIALMFVPLLLMVGWIEAVQLITVRYAEMGLVRNLGLTQGIMVLAGTGCVFVCAPLLIRSMWDTIPLPAGELRDRLLRMCRQHRVGVRELLLWRTFGGMINAAVMGLVAPLRYILLSDGLLEMLHGRQVEAVMAHELAHVRKGHMLWLVVAAMSAMLLLGEVWARAMQVVVGHFEFADAARWQPLLGEMLAGSLADTQYHELLAAVGAVGCWIFVFGWISRRFERQADAFAVVHLSRNRVAAPVAATLSSASGIAVAQAPQSDDHCIDEDSVAVMSEALGQVARLNHIPLRKRSWRHGSIHWRQQYLCSLVGRDVRDLAIDRQITALKIASLAALVIVAALILM